jgi:hypothetical protein
MLTRYGCLMGYVCNSRNKLLDLLANFCRGLGRQLQIRVFGTGKKGEGYLQESLNLRFYTFCCGRLGFRRFE